jgi:hypothetical protein
MRDIEKKENPTILKTQVRFRNAKGHFCKPHQARTVEFVPPRARKKVVYELPSGRKTKAEALGYAREAYDTEVKSREAVRIAREEKERRELEPARRAAKPKAPKLKLRKTEISTHSRALGVDLHIVGYNFTFDKKMPIDQSNFINVADMVRGMVTESAVRIFKKDKLKNKLMYVKIFGDGYYMRTGKTRGRKKDLLGFSIPRWQATSTGDVEAFVDLIIQSMIEKFMPSVSGRGRVDGYFMHKFQSNDLYLTGFRVEWVEEI